MRRVLIVGTLVVTVVASGVATATVLSRSGPSAAPSPKKALGTEAAENEREPGGTTRRHAAVHGGPIDRFHDSSACNLVDVSTLVGNWTHGDYVSAVAALGQPSLVPKAARSDCGKPMVAVGHRHGPPDFVQQKLEQRLGSAGRSGHPAAPPSWAGNPSEPPQTPGS
jgi:hypothetical protein